MLDSELPPASKDSPANSPLSEGARRLMMVQLEIEAKGYTPGLARAAVQRAWGSAEYKTRDISGPIREQAFLDILTAELRRAETWVQQEMKNAEGPVSDKV